MSNFIGIDLGTTYSCVGVWKNNKVEIITNNNGNRTTPSYISFNGKERYIGESAKDQLSRNMNNTIFDIKRLIGKKYDDKIIQDDYIRYPYKIVEGENNTILVKVTVDEFNTETNIYESITKLFKPEELSAMILKKLKSDAEIYLGESVTDAVITVPAYFNDSQRQATKDAGLIAGLNVLRVINEPTAAAIAYNITSQRSYDDKNVVVFDLGGGTLDVTVLTMCDSVLNVKSTSGDTHLGGEDFDNLLVDYCLRSFASNTFRPTIKLTCDEKNIICSSCNISSITKVYTLNKDILNLCIKNINEETIVEQEQKHNITNYLTDVINVIDIMEDIYHSTKSIGKLKKVCENAKKNLSTNETAIINADAFYCHNGNIYDLEVKITRQIFEKLCDTEFEKCMEPVNRALQDANLTYDNIQEVVLIGGSTRIPKIKELLESKFKAKIKNDINPDEAVAYGATIQASILSGIRTNDTKDLVLMDVTPLSLGLETAGGVMSILVKRNTQIPFDAEQIYSTYTDNQPAVSIKIYEGERQLTKHNNLLGTFDLENIPPMPKGIPKIKVKFSVDENGILVINAIEESTSVTKKITIKNNKGRVTKAEIEKMIEDSEKYEKEDKKQKEVIEVKIELEKHIYVLTRTLNEPKFKDIMGNAVYETISNSINSIRNELNEDDDIVNLEKYNELKTQIEEIYTDNINKYLKLKT
jgi:molecular chaperone DnaK (HSP70)